MLVDLQSDLHGSTERGWSVISKLKSSQEIKGLSGVSFAKGHTVLLQLQTLLSVDMAGACQSVLFAY